MWTLIGLMLLLALIAAGCTLPAGDELEPTVSGEVIALPSEAIETPTALPPEVQTAPTATAADVVIPQAAPTDAPTVVIPQETPIPALDPTTEPLPNFPADLTPSATPAVEVLTIETIVAETRQAGGQPTATGGAPSPQTDTGGIPIITATAIYITPSGPEAPVALPSATPTLAGAPPSAGAAGTVPETTTPLEELPEGCYYEVRRGDSLFGIALANDLSLDALRQANPDVEPDELQIGQRLRLPTCIAPEAPTATLPPGVTPTVTPSVSPTPTLPPGSVIYTVRPGDTVYAIATRFGTTVRAIVNANPRLQANPNLLSIGQELIIPVPATAAPAAAATVQTATPPAASPIEPVTTPTRIGGG